MPLDFTPQPGGGGNTGKPALIMLPPDLGQIHHVNLKDHMRDWFLQVASSLVARREVTANNCTFADATFLKTADTNMFGKIVALGMDCSAIDQWDREARRGWAKDVEISIKLADHEITRRYFEFQPAVIDLIGKREFDISLMFETGKTKDFAYDTLSITRGQVTAPTTIIARWTASAFPDPDLR